jgi:hypothetical protein
MISSGAAGIVAYQPIFCHKEGQMNARKLFALTVVLALVMLGLVSVTSAQGPTPRAPRAATSTALSASLGTGFTYQGQLKSGGSAVNGLCDFQFGLWDDASVGAQKGVTQTVTSVSVTNGLFTTTLNGGSEFGASAFDGNARWLAIAVQCPAGSGGYTPLTPRQALTPSPYALYATSATIFTNALAGDVTGTQSATTVGKLQGYTVASTAPTDGQVLRYNGTQWAPATLATGAYWNLTGNSGTIYGTHFLGTTDNVSLTLRANNLVGWRLAPSGTNTPNVIGGYSGNWVTSGVKAATIGGGGASGNPNRVTDDYGVVGGGINNQAGDNAGGTSDRLYSTVGGGSGNTASGGGATIGGGESNTASRNYATVGGGHYNTASNFNATIGGGYSNTADSDYATIGGGSNNTASGGFATVGGGVYNAASDRATVGGGESNTASSLLTTIGGGSNNTSSNSYATVAGGFYNTASGLFATVPGGRSNSATMPYTLAAGRRAQANHDGAFVWADSTDADFASSASNQFAVRANGGVVFNTGAATVQINGNTVWHAGNAAFWNLR